MSISKKLQQYDRLQKEICTHFGISMSEPFEFVDVGWWMLSDTESFYYGYGNVDEDTDSGRYYGGEIYGTSVWQKTSVDDFTMLVYDNGCGDRLRIVVANGVEVTDPEQIEKVLNA